MHGEIHETILDLIKVAGLVIEILAVIIIVGAVLYGTARYLHHVWVVRRPRRESYTVYRHTLARAMLGLEILVAADIIRTVALDTSIESVVVLSLLGGIHPIKDVIFK